MSKRISLLGSTGSIGRQTLDVIDACGMEVAAITANSSVDRLEEQARRYHPELAVLMDEKAADDLKVRLADTSVKVLAGMDGLMEAAALPSADTVLTAVVGMVGLRPTMAAIREGSRRVGGTVFQCGTLSMKVAASGVISLTDDLIVLYDDSPHHGVWAGPSGPLFRQL